MNKVQGTAWTSLTKIKRWKIPKEYKDSRGENISVPQNVVSLSLRFQGPAACLVVILLC